jgi:hypothetical protein
LRKTFTVVLAAAVPLKNRPGWSDATVLLTVPVMGLMPVTVGAAGA